MNVTEAQSPSRPPMITWFWAILGLVSLTAIFGNAMVMFLIVRCRRLRVIPNWFIFALALADFMVGATIIPCDFVCQYWRSCNQFTLRLAFDIIIHFSVTSLCAMTFERYVAIAKPLNYHDFMTKRRVLLIIFASWCFGALIPIAGYACMIHKKTVADKVFRIMNTIFLQILPPILLVLVFILMVFIAKKHERKEKRQLNQLDYNYSSVHHKDRVKNLRERTSVKMMGVVITIFVMCYILAMFRSLYFYIMDKNIPLTVTHVSRILIMTNSSVNFIVYAFLKKDFKQEIRRLAKSYTSR